MDCPHCGHTIPEDSEFCNYCGRKINDKVDRRNRWLKAIVILLVIAIIATCLYLFRSTPTRSTRRFLDAVQEQDWDTARKYYSGDPANLGIPDASTLEKFGKGGAELYQKMLDKGCDFQYEVVSEKRNGREAEVTVAFTTYDFSSLFRGKGVQSFDSLSRGLDGLTQRTKHTQCDFQLKRNKWGRWKVSMLGIDQIDAMTGGVYSGLVQTIESAVGAPVSGVSEAASDVEQALNDAFSSLAEEVERAVGGSGSGSGSGRASGGAARSGRGGAGTRGSTGGGAAESPRTDTRERASQAGREAAQSVSSAVRAFSQALKQ